MTVYDVLAAVGSAAGTVLLFDYVRLRRAEYLDSRAAKALAAMADQPATTKCAVCSAPRSSVCSDGRCRYHCRLYCECRANK